MQRELIILCHGKANVSSGKDDYYLPLKDRSKREAQLLGSWLQQQGLIPDYIISSPTKAAYDTAVYACNVMGLNRSAIHTEKRIRRADKKALLISLAACPADAKRVLLVGHNPALEMLLQLLSDEKISSPKKGKLFPEASLAILQTAKQWAKLTPGKASLSVVTRPDDLPAEFPFLNPDDTLEWRERPAYYYSQSAVIPYRIRNAKVEILIITSSSNKRWIIPKGVIDVGLSAQASAAKEAFEEAGVLGRVRDSLLGTYLHKKWGAECIVKVYSMEVFHIICEEERLEPQRQRRWIRADQAPDYLQQKDVLAMVSKLTRQLMLAGEI